MKQSGPLHNGPLRSDSGIAAHPFLIIWPPFCGQGSVVKLGIGNGHGDPVSVLIAVVSDADETLDPIK